MNFLLSKLVLVYQLFLLTAGHIYVEKPFIPVYNEVKSVIDTYCPLDKQLPLETLMIGIDDFKEDSTLGLCTRIPMHSVIKINSRRWNGFNAEDQYQIFAHEMAHCVLGAPHIDNKNHFMYANFARHFTKEEVNSQIKDLCTRGKYANGRRYYNFY